MKTPEKQNEKFSKVIFFVGAFTLIGQNSGEIHLEQQRSKEEAELLRIFSGLDVKRRMELLMTAIRLDEEQNQ